MKTFSDYLQTLNEDVHGFKFKYWGIVLPNGKIIDGLGVKGAITHPKLKDMYPKIPREDIAEWLVDPAENQLHLRAFSKKSLSGLLKAADSLPDVSGECSIEIRDTSKRIYRGREDISVSAAKKFISATLAEFYD
jgi:hypothetical protein